MLEALKALLETVPDAAVERNNVLPEKIPAGGLIILRDGDPGEPEQALGGFGSTYYQHAIEIEVHLEEGDAAARDAVFDSPLQQIGVAFEADPTLGGLAFRLTYGRPEPAIEAIAGAPAIKRRRGFPAQRQGQSDPAPFCADRVPGAGAEKLVKRVGRNRAGAFKGGTLTRREHSLCAGRPVGGSR